MNYIMLLHSVTAVLLFSAVPSFGEIAVVIGHNDSAAATPGFTFTNVPPPSMNDAGTKAKFVIIDGDLDSNSATGEKLHDGKLPVEGDEPEENLFFQVGTDGGRLLVDLQRVISLKQVNTYSWHDGSRGPQVYTLYASDGRSAAFNPRPGKRIQPEKCGWSLITKVDTRKKHKHSGGQYGVSISDSSGEIGKSRYLLFVTSRTRDEDRFGNTFYSEIDVIDGDASEPPRRIETEPPPPNISRTFPSDGGKYQITIDPSRAPDLADWAFKELAPVAQEWYPKIIKLLPSEGFQPPDKVTIDFGKSNGGYVAITHGNRITCTTSWFRDNQQGEAKGCLVHELVHVVQYYGHGTQRANASPAPFWLSEGIPDYIRWFIYEPQAHGADLVWMRQQKNFTPRYDGGYRISANFLNWATQKYDTNLVQRLNVALREGDYSKNLWPEITGQKIDKLSKDWKKGLNLETSNSPD